MFGALSPPSRAAGASDGRRDDRDDLRSDQISAYVLGEEDGGGPAGEFGDGDEEENEIIDPWDALDAQEHRKKMNVWKLSSKRRAEKAARVQEDRPSLTTLHTDAMLMRNAAIPNAVWTLGDNSHGQCGHSADGSEPRPVPLELAVLRDGVSSLHAGPYCTILVTSNGDAIGFGSGPFRQASDAPKPEPPSKLAYEGAPPFRVETFDAPPDRAFKGFGPPPATHQPNRR